MTTRQPARRSRRQERGVAGDVHGDLAGEVAPQWDECLEQFPGGRRVCEQVVVDEEEEPFALPGDLRDDVGDRPRPHPGAVERVDGAEVTRKSATAAELHQPERCVPLAGERRPVEPEAVQPDRAG